MKTFIGPGFNSTRALCLRNLFGVLALSLAPSISFGVTVHDEDVNGDFLGTGDLPTSLGVLAVGSNEVYGATGRDATGVRDLDYFSFTIPAGYQLSEVRLLEAAAASTGFAAFEAGGQVTVPPNTMSAAGLLGWVHYKDTQIGTDILDDIGSGPGATGFTPPLPAGTYSVWVQDGNPGPLPYGFDFIVSAVPEHGSGMTELGLAVLATASLFGRKRICTA